MLSAFFMTWHHLCTALCAKSFLHDTVLGYKHQKHLSYSGISLVFQYLTEMNDMSTWIFKYFPACYCEHIDALHQNTYTVRLG